MLLATGFVLLLTASAYATWRAIRRSAVGPGFFDEIPSGLDHPTLEDAISGRGGQGTPVVMVDFYRDIIPGAHIQ